MSNTNQALARVIDLLGEDEYRKLRSRGEKLTETLGTDIINEVMESTLRLAIEMTNPHVVFFVEKDGKILKKGSNPVFLKLSNAIKFAKQQGEANVHEYYVTASGKGLVVDAKTDIKEYL